MNYNEIDLDGGGLEDFGDYSMPNYWALSKLEGTTVYVLTLRGGEYEGAWTASSYYGSRSSAMAEVSVLQEEVRKRVTACYCGGEAHLYEGEFYCRECGRSWDSSQDEPVIKDSPKANLGELLREVMGK